MSPGPKSFDSLCPRLCARGETAKIEARRAKLRLLDTRVIVKEIIMLNMTHPARAGGHWRGRLPRAQTLH